MGNGWFNLIYYIDLYADQYLMILILTFFIYYFFCIKKLFIDIFDPLFIAILSSMFAITVPVFMEYIDLFENESFFWSCIVSEIAYICGLLVFSKYTRLKIFFRVNSADIINSKMKSVLYFTYVSLYFLLNLISFVQYGIPLFDFDSHVEAALQNGSYTKFLDAISLPLIFLCIDRIANKKYFDSIFVGIGIVVIMMLSGSKGALLLIGMSIFFYRIYLLKFNISLKFNFKKIYGVVFFIALIGAFIPILYASIDQSFMAAGMKLLVRIIGYGDVFAYFYGSNIADFIIEKNNFFTLILEPLGAVFRLIPYDGINGDIGFQICKEIYNTNELLAGPNGRHNVFGLVCFGLYGAPIYSFLLGLGTSFVCRYVYARYKNFNTFTFLIYTTVIYYGITAASTELSLGINHFIFGCLFNGFIMWVVYKIMLTIQ